MSAIYCIQIVCIPYIYTYQAYFYSFIKIITEEIWAKLVPFIIIFSDYITYVNSPVKQDYKNKSIFIWFFTLTLMTFFMIFVGGLTRLTDSGLSIVDWRPIMGSIPPLNEKNWIEVFKLYQNSPEFLIINNNMTLFEFKYIFWWEWFHRFFARLIGIIFILPLIYFIITKQLTKKLFGNLIILLFFGIFQALAGWWMVKSGLSNDPYVSPYRLTFHLTNAVIILTILFWLTLNSYNNISLNFIPKQNKEFYIFFIITLLIITIISGGFMAGSNAGQSFNTYPLMNGKLLPEDYFLYKIFYKNFFENTVAINFNHRWIATICFVNIIYLTFYLKFIKKIKNINFKILAVNIFVFIQFMLGILTLISNVKIHFASLHQVNSMLLLGSLIYLYYSIKNEKRN